MLSIGVKTVSDACSRGVRKEAWGDSPYSPGSRQQAPPVGTVTGMASSRIPRC